jgi:NAD(P)-dependent dehydrogenase (short-subunit alcohol dehydrogenase family)
LPIEEFRRVIEIGVTGSLLCAQEAGRRMIAAGRGGSIINISSIAGASAVGRGNLAHSVNKGAINMMTKELAVEWAKHGIRVNAILPCQVLTEGFQKWLDSPGFDQALMDRFLEGIPMNRLALAEDIAGPAVFLASDAAAMVTGTLLAVDGGNLAFNAGGSHTWHTA